MATLDEAFDILDQLKANNDPRYNAARDSLQQQIDAYDAQAAEQRSLSYQPPPGPHQLPTQTDYLRGLTHGDDWQSGQGTVRRALAPVIEYGQGVKDYFFPPTVEQTQQRPYQTQELGGSVNQLGAVTQDWLSGIVQNMINSPGKLNLQGSNIGGIDRMRFDQTYPSAPGGVGDPSGFDRQMALEADARRGSREAILGPARDWIEGGAAMGNIAALSGDASGATGNVAEDFLFTPFPTKQERAEFVPLTREEVGQPSIVAGLNRGDLTGLVDSLEMMGPALATMLTTKNPKAALAMFAPPVFGKTYDEHIKSGKAPEEALELAKKAVIFEVVPELLLWGPFKLVKSPLMAIFASIPAEAASEAITELGYIQDEWRNQGKRFTSEEIIARVKHAAKMGAYMGPALGMSFSMPHLYGAIAKGSPKQVVKILQKHREKMVADGAPAVRIEIIDATIAELNDNTLSPDEHARALKNLESSGALGAVYERPGERTRGSWNIDPLNPAVEGGTVVRNEEQLPDFTDWQTWIENRENAKLDETQVDIPERGAAIFSPTAIIKRLTQENGGRRPSRSQVKQRTIDLINEEVGQHGGLRAAIQALGLSIDEQDAFYDRMLRENKEEIEAWKKGEGKAYTRRAVDGGVYFNSSEVVDEWLAHLNRQRQRGLAINKAPIGKYIRHIIQTFKKGAELDLTVAEATEIVDKLQSRLGRRGSDLATPQAEEAPQVTETPDTSQADLDAATAERQVQERILDEQTSSLERSTFGDTRFAKGPDIDNRRQTAIAKAMAPNKHIRESDLRMNAIQENWEDNKDDLEFRRDYASFKEFEQAEWDLNYDMWIDEVQEAQAEETDTNVTQLEVDPSIEELRAAREATQVQLTQLDEQLASLERDTMGDTRFAKAADLDAAGILNRNVRNDFAKGPYKDIAERADEAEIRARIKRLGNLYGPMGQKRGIEPGDRATAKEQAQNAIDNVDAFEEFMAPFEEQMKTQPARSKTAEGRQEKYAERKGITVAEILSYRDRGKTHPMEKKMSYSFAMDEINRLEEAGEATAEEAEARRRALNDLRNQLGGKMPAGAKRRATEIAYGIGDYANLEAWSYTEAETTSMEERAELARGKERVRGLSRTEKTEQELEEITGTDVTPTEMLQIASMAEVEVFDHLKSDEARLQYLREKEAMPASERDALDAFMKDIKGWNQEAYEAQVAAELEAQVEKVGVTKVEQTPTQRKAELKEMKEAQAPIEKRKHVQVEPDFFDSLLDTNFTTQGEAVPDGFMELTEEGEWSEVDDTDTGTRYAKAPDVKQFNEDGGAQSYKDGIDDIILQAIDDGLSYEDFHSLVTAYLNEKVGPTGTVNEKASFTRIQYLRADSELYSHYLGELQYYKEQVDGKKEEVVEKLTATERDNLNREMMSLKATEAEKNQLSWLKKFGANLNRVFGRDFMEVEDIINITRRELVDGEATSDGRVMHGEFIRGERGVRTADNLIIMPLIFHRIKTKFERAHVGLGFQSAQPYVDMVRISKIPEEAAKYGIDSPKDQETIKQFVLFKKALRSEFQKMWDKEDFTYNSLQNAYETALKAAKVKLNLKDPSNLKTFRKDNEVEETEKAIRVMLAVGLRKFTPEMKEMSIDLETGEAQNELVSNRTIQAATDGVVRFAKRSKGDSYEEHFNKSFWYTLTSYLWGKPVQAIRDFNKLSRFGQAKADIPAADEIADEVQRAHSSTQRAGDLVYGTDIVQDTSIMTGQFYTRLAQIFSRVTARFGDIETKENQILVDVLTGKIRIEEIDNAEVREAAKLLRELIQEVYDYAKNETKGLKKPLDLRGHGDTLLPRVWNIEFLATRRGKAKFLKAIRAAITDPATGSSILEDSELTVEDLYNVVVNSGGFVQGDWTNLKADQTRDQKEIDRDLRAQEYLDALPTESLIDEDLVMIDLQAIIPRFLQKAVERTEYSKRFGVNDEILREKIKEGLEQIKVHNAKVLKLDKTDTSLTYIDPRAFEKSIWDMMRILRNKYGYDMANMQTRAWLQRVVNFEVVAKLPLVTLASMPELFTPMLRGDVRADKWIVDLMMGLSWAGYKGMNGISKLLLNKHLPAMRKMSKDIGGIGVVSDMQLLRELGIAEIQAMGDSVSTRYANPNFARGGLRAGARTTIAGRIPKKVRAVFNMQTYMQATLLTTLTEMQQLMALRNFQRHMAKRVKFVQKNKDKELKGRRLRLFKQFSKDMADFGLPQNIDLSTPAGEAEFNAGAIRFVDQVITRPNDATTAKAFKNPLTAPIFLFKRFITTFGNTLMTAVGNDIATKVDNIEKAKQVGRIATTMVAMYGAVMFAEIMRAVIKGDLDEDDMTITGGDFRTFVRRVDRTGLLSAPGAMLLNLSFPYKRGWWDSPEARIWGELGGPIGGDVSALMKTGFDRRPGSAQRLIRQMIPMSKKLIDLPPKQKRASSKTTKRKIKF